MSDLKPGISLGFSLSSPANNFYFGLSHEILRNVQWSMELRGQVSHSRQLVLSMRHHLECQPRPTAKNLTRRIGRVHVRHCGLRPEPAGVVSTRRRHGALRPNSESVKK